MALLPLRILFFLFSREHFHKRSNMMAMESSQHHQPYLASSCFSTMDPTLFDPFVYHVDSMSAFDPDATTTTPTTATTTTTTPPPSLAQSYFDASASLHDSTPSVATSQAADTFIPTLSTASAAPSIASASSSVIGSPYSGTALQQEPWVDTSNGLGLPGAVMSDLFPNDYMGNALDPDPAFCQEKFSDSFVGELQQPAILFCLRFALSLLTVASFVHVRSLLDSTD